VRRRIKPKMSALIGKRMFPCPVCTDPREVKITKKAKPYITCDPCGIQVFIRGPAGISAFNRLVEGAASKDVWTRLREMERLYRLKCSECGCRFWIEPNLVKTSMFDGTLQGFRCPEKRCGAVVEWGKEE
jgi:transcription elongation factor Elf1